MVVDVLYEREEGDDRHIRIAFVQDLVRIAGYDDTCLDSKACVVAYVLSDDGGVGVDGSHDLCTMLMKIAENVLAHLSASVLYDSDLFHVWISFSASIVKSDAG